MAIVSNVLVIGGGIGGLTASIALRQAGIAVDLVEIQTDWTVYGVGIIQPNNTLRALEKIGLAKACVDLGGAFDCWRLFDGAGNALFDTPKDNSAAPAYPANNGITRPIMHALLCGRAAELGVPVRLGVTPERFEQSAEAVTVFFNDGTDKAYDLVIAAEGMYSKTRDALFPGAAAPHFTGQGVWRYNLPRPASVKTGEVHSSAHKKVGLVPMSPSLMYMFVVSERIEIARDDPGLADAMRSHLSEYTGPIAELAKLITDPNEVVYRPMESVMLEPAWHKGRIIIIGDAAHAATPHLAQGAAMAIEDAVLLAEMLQGGGAIDGVLTAFTRRRLPRAKYIVDSSLQIGVWEQEQWAGIHSPGANPGMLLGQATHAMMEPY